MVKLDMNGSYELKKEKIEEKITKISSGNYALGHIKDKSFIVEYVGRSDDDLNKRLIKWVSSYKRFKFSYATSPKAAFEKECKNYHDFGENKSLDNKIHPDRPDGSSWACSDCDIYD